MDTLAIPGLVVEEEVGRGSYSVVYRAVRQGRSYALKVRKEVRPEEAEAELLSFLREAAALACVSHPGLPAIHEVGTLGDRPYLIMDYVQGESLDRTLDGRPQPRDRVLSVARQVASVLGEVHRRGIIHRDIKPGNIILDDGGGLKLTDFNLATHADSRVDGGLTIVGTFLYCSPEQSGMLQRPVRGPADLYSLGVVLYEMATGVTPFRADDPAELIRLHATQPVPPPTGRNPNLSPALEAILLKLLAKDPDDRYATAEDLAYDLERLDELDREFYRGGKPHLGGDEAAETFRTGLWGRDQELNELLARWADAARGRGGLTLVEGEAGSGKSRLVGELLARARVQGALVLTGKCSRQDGLPFISLKRALEDYLERLRHRPDERRSAIEEDLRKAAGDYAPLLRRFSPGLARLWPGKIPELGPGAQELFYQALSHFLLELARLRGPAVLFLDDVHWLDDASRDVLVGLVRRLPKAPLLAVFTARNEPEYSEPVDRLLRSLQLPPARIILSPLRHEDLRRLVGELLGGKVDDQVADQIARRSQGRPFAAGEYVRGMLESGLLRPSWGEWKLDPARLERLNLPDDLLQLVLRRCADLSEGAQPVLQAAALVGAQFDLTVLSEVTDRPRAEVDSALFELERISLIESVGHGVYRFVHDQIRDAFLKSLDERERRRLHQRIAEALERLSPEDVYALAHHYAHGDLETNPRPAARASRQAGLAALAQYAAEEAYHYLQRAAEWGERGPDQSVALGEACVRTGRIAEGLVHLEEALSGLSDPVARAGLRARMARANLMNFDTTQTREQLELGFAELGAEVPGWRPWGALTTLGQAGLRLLRRHLFRQPGPHPDASLRRKTLLELYDLMAEVAYTESQPLLLAEVGLLSLEVARRVGQSPERVMCYARHALIMASLGRSKRAEHFSQEAIRDAEQLDDPQVLARAHLFRAMIVLRSGAPLEAEHLMRRCLQEHGRWLSVADYLNAVTDLVWNLLMRGYLERALEWADRGLTRTRGNRVGELHGHVLLPFAGSLKAFLGKPAEGQEALGEFREIAEEDSRERYRQSLYLQHRILYLVEQGELGAELEGVLDQHSRLGFSPSATSLHVRSFYVFQAHARLAQARAAPSAERAPALTRLEQSLAELHKAVGGPLLRAHWQALAGACDFLAGRTAKAVRRLRQASALAREYDCPWVSLVVSRNRAAILQGAGRQSTATREARTALQLAEEMGWKRLVRILVHEFHLENDAQPAPQLTFRTYRSSTEGVKIQRYLDALLRLSSASTRILDVAEQARASLDESIRVFGAERAFLFLRQPDGLAFYAGRNARGDDLAEVTAYSTTVVEQVRASREPLVVSGSEDRAILASASAIAHDLRSLMAAPLLHRDQVTGVVYLDNRVARGIFTHEDGQILAAMANHIAIAIETARAGQLELGLQSERQQRELADTLREVSKNLSSTLDRVEVLRRTMHSLATLVPFERSLALLVEGVIRLEPDGPSQELTGITGLGYAGEASRVRLPCRPGELLADSFLSGAPIHVPDALHEPRYSPPLEVVPPARSLLAVPLTSYQEKVGLLLLERTAVRPFSDNEVAMVLAVIEPAGIALKNALLYAEVQRLATTDELTEVANRRQLFQLGEVELARATRSGKPLTALMIDIDHFKQFNDQYGHAVGDLVLRAMAATLKAGLRTVDVLGRYGGEEFAALLPETDLEGATQVAERLRHVAEEGTLDSPRGPLRVTISVGVALWRPEDDLSQLLHRADRALYAAKEGGRNRVCLESQEPGPAP
ncbi:MAG: diguanylate cyclase [Candidatus Eremiobacterota bacterium]